MFCPQCGNNVKDGMKFCGSCGWAVPATAVQAAVIPTEKKCASCGTVLKDGASFCPNCGHAVHADVPAPVLPNANNAAVTETKDTAPETKGGDKPKPKKSNAIDKAVFHRLGGQAYACYLYKDGVVVGNMTDTNGAFILDVGEWLETRYENLIIETVGEK